VTYLCVPIFVHNVEQARRDVGAAIEAGAEMVELRLDDQADATVARSVVSQFQIPMILTCRPTWEGGRSELSNEARINLLSEIAPTDERTWIDFEIKGAKATALDGIGNPLILSAHDFKGRPDRLYNLIEEMNASPAGVSKLAWTARTIRDNIEAFEILLHRQKPMIALCMGEAGLMSRVLAKKFGAFLTFASLHDEAATAPGQVTIRDMKRLYRWDALRPDTRVYGVVGSPVAHSMSPAIHNAAFDRIGFNGVYLPMLVNEGYESFKAFMETLLSFAPLHLSGLSVTIPHKENALRYLIENGHEVDPLARRIGALNTIVISRDLDRVSLRGFSTDYSAILDSITHTLGITRADLAGRRVAVLGAGGTGRTAVAALAHCGATVVVYNRTREKADALAAEFDGKSGKVVAADLGSLCKSCCQIYINTTSVGMHPHVDASPFGDNPPAIGPDTLVFDTIYNPLRTRLLEYAESRGAKTIGGIEMFIRQAAGQFESWTTQPAPLDLMREVVETRLRNHR
jgi:3-dehydroquinate dehydratase/shikimate dehydrogenase